MVVRRALLDTGVLVAFLHRDDAAHEAAVASLSEYRGTLLTTEAVLTESMVLLGRTTGGIEGCFQFFLQGGAVLVPASRASLARSRAVVERYADLPADYADATLVSLADEMDAYTIFTLDRRDFSVYRGKRGEAFELRP